MLPLFSYLNFAPQPNSKFMNDHATQYSTSTNQRAAPIMRSNKPSAPLENTKPQQEIDPE